MAEEWTGERGSLALRPLLALAALKLVLWAAVGGRYGFHRDELYYLVGGSAGAALLPLTPRRPHGG